MESPAFRKLLNFQRGTKAKDSDIPGRSKFTKLVEERAHDVQKDLKRQMNVRSILFFDHLYLFSIYRKHLDEFH